MIENTTLHKALITIRKLKKLLQDQNKIIEPIAIVGMSCRFPQAMNKNEYWDLLSRGENIISEMPDERWQLLKNSNEYFLRNKKHRYWGGFLKNIADFDAYFFGISPREAMRMDPQQRLLLEVAYEAIEDAGIPIETLAGSQTGVFASLYGSQLGYLQKLETDMDALYLPTGNAISIAANRLSYLFDLRGPSLVLDTACSSSLVAIHLACLNLQNNACDAALVAGVNINLLPSMNSILAQAKMLSPDGQCKTFDASANGYVQGEGVGVIMLKPLSKALQDNNRIYAVINASGVNQDGKTNGLTAPNGLQQEILMKNIYQKANINPHDIGYIECHGTGTFLGDPIELEALGNIVGKNRESQNPCWIGSVKTNIGHLEPAAGIASVIKVALALKSAQIPPHLNFETPNPHIDFDQYHLQIPKKMEQWPRYGTRLIAGVSGFGFGGTNAHVVMSEFSEEKSVEQKNKIFDKEIFTISAKDPVALNQLVDKWCQYLENNLTLDIGQVCYNTHLRRSHYSHRLSLIIKSTAELYRALCEAKENPALFRKSPALEKNTAVLDTEALILVAYLNHEVVDWHKYEEGRHYAHLDMPLYAWQHKNYWPPLQQYQNNDSAIDYDYPMRGKNISSPLGILQFQFMFDTKNLPEIKDTYHILHAGYYLEMLAFAVDEMFENSYFSVENMVFSAPILVADNSIVSVQLILEKLDDGILFNFYSQTTDQGKWVEHTKGKLFTENKATKAINKIKVIDSLKKNYNQHESAEVFFNRVLAMGMPAGDSIRWTQQYWKKDNEILCEFKAPIVCENADLFKLKIHPGIIDGCVQPLFLLLPDDLMNPYVVSSIKNLTYFGGGSADLSNLYLFEKLQKIKNSGEKIMGDWQLLTLEGQIVIECEGMCMSRLDNKIKIQNVIGIDAKQQVDLATLADKDRRSYIINYIAEQIAVIFSMPKKDIEINRSLREMGMDSLMSLVLLRILETSFGMTYSLQLLQEGPSIVDIAAIVLAQKFPDVAHENSQAEPIILEKPAWIVYRNKSAQVKTRLFCFPYGGGGASIYRDWQQDLPNTIEVCPIQLPGREDRMHEKSLDNLNILLDLLIENIQSEFDLPFAFFGHSFGSLIAFELTRLLRQRQMPLPQHLFVSAFPDPQEPTRSLDVLLAQLKNININLSDIDNMPAIENLSDEQLNKMSIIFNENGIADYGDHLMNRNVVKVLLPIFMGDMSIVKNYQYHEEAPLDLPISVFLGLRDTWVSYEEHFKWLNYTHKQCVFHKFDSGHLFLKDTHIKKAMLQDIHKALSESPMAEVI